MRGKKELERELIFAEAKIKTLEDRVQFLQEEKELLYAQNGKLQEALIAVRAPEAYRDQWIEKEQAKLPPLTDEDKKRSKIFQDTTTKYINGMEDQLLRTPEDLDDLLATALTRDRRGTTSLHGNSES